METAGICWVILKIRHMMEASTHPTIMYTDHAPAVPIATQTSLTTTSLVRINMRHVRALEYLSRFRLELRHMPGKQNIIPDALSRLEKHAEPPQNEEEAYLVTI
jgi:hypothetical protein